MDNISLRAVGYRRVSMREQVDGFSLVAQETNIRKYAEDHGWEVTGLYTDAGISAKRDSQRPQFIQLLEDAEAHKFDVVIVDKIDRFYRFLSGLLNTLDRLKEADVFFVSVQERLDFTTPWGKLTLTMLGMLAEIYIDNLRQETTKGKVQRARDGFWNGNIPLCWLLVSSARICVVNSQKPKYKKPTFEGRFFVVTCSKSYILRSRRG